MLTAVLKAIKKFSYAIRVGLLCVYVHNWNVSFEISLFGGDTHYPNVFNTPLFHAVGNNQVVTDENSTLNTPCSAAVGLGRSPIP